MEQYLCGRVLHVFATRCLVLDRLDTEAWYKEFLSAVADAIGMTPISEPSVVRYDCESNPDLSGYSAHLFIAESHINIHGYPHGGHARVMVDSCKDFDPEFAASFIAQRLRCRVWFYATYGGPMGMGTRAPDTKFFRRCGAFVRGTLAQQGGTDGKAVTTL